MSIDVDLASLKRSRNPWRNELRFELRGTFALSPNVELLTDRSQRAERAIAGSGNPVRVSQWLRTATGWCGVLDDCADFDDALEWFEHFVREQWSPADDGRIIGAPRSRGPHIGALPNEPTALVAYDISDLNRIPHNERAGAWAVRGSLTGFLAEQAQAWIYRRGAKHYLTRDADWQVELAGVDNEDAIAQAIQRYAACEITSVLRGPIRLRQAAYWAQGKAVYQDCDSTTDWREKVDLLRKVLFWAPPSTNYGAIRTLPGHLPGWPNDPHIWPHVTESEVRYNMPLLASTVPDASGVQLLTDVHLERASNLSEWNVTAVAGGRHLVEAPDLTSWYAQPVSEAVLAKARADFGEMILRSEMLEK